MRVTLAASFDKQTRNIARTQEDIDRLSTQAATGKRMAAPHDDPVAWSQAMDAKQGLRELATFKENMEFSTGWNNATEAALDQFGDLLIQAKEVGMSAVSQSTPEQTAANYQSVVQIAKDALALANTQHGNSYIFSGTSTSTPPFQSGSYNYFGDTNPIQVRVGKNVHDTVNVDGLTAFYLSSSDPNSSILKTLDDMAVAIQNGDTPTIQNLLTSIDQGYQHINTNTATVGARLKHLDNKQNALSSVKLGNEDYLSDLEGADMAEVITQYQLKKTTLQAALQTTAMLGDLNLTKFL